MQLNLDKKNKKILFFFLISLFTISILLFLSFNGFWSLTHGPLYFFLGDGINSNGELSSTIYVKPDNFDVYTFQIGIAYLHFLSIFLLNENWFIFYIAFISFIWSFVLNKVYSELQKFNLNNLDISIILFIIFFQPYNLNQIANFSNESIYFPLLIYFFFFSLNLANQSLNNVIANNKLNICIFLIFLLLDLFLDFTI